MFTQLIASRPARSRSAQGTTFSLAMHATVFTVAILLTAESKRIADPMPTRVIPLAPFRDPVPAPAPPRPTPPVKTPVLTEPAPVPAPPVPVINDVPTEIPAPATEPVLEPVAADPSAGQPTAPGTGEPTGGEPWSGALGTSEVDLAAALLPRSPLPRYPDLLRRTGLEGVARARFVVGTDGRVEMETLEIVEASHPAFAEALRAAIPRLRFRPARVGARRVRQLVEFPVGFRIEDR